MLMCAHNRAVNHGVLIVHIASQCLKYGSPYATFAPSAMTCMHHSEVTKTLWQIPPRNSCPIPIPYCLYEQSIVSRRDPNVPLSAGQKVFNPLPLVFS